jgi:hypothetical protein
MEATAAREIMCILAGVSSARGGEAAIRWAATITALLNPRLLHGPKIGARGISDE